MLAWLTQGGQRYHTVSTHLSYNVFWNQPSNLMIPKINDRPDIYINIKLGVAPDKHCNEDYPFVENLYECQFSTHAWIKKYTLIYEIRTVCSS